MHKNTEFKPEEGEGCFDALLNVPNVELIHVQQDCGWRGFQIDAPLKLGGTRLAAAPRSSSVTTRRCCGLRRPAAVTEDDRSWFKGGKGTPEPLMLVRHAGLGSIDDLCRKTLALTKMDWKNDGPYDRLPVTLSFAKTLAKVVRRMPTLEPRSYAFCHFM